MKTFGERKITVAFLLIRLKLGIYVGVIGLKMG